MKNLLYSLLMLTVVAFTACNDDDGHPAVELNEAQKAFIETKYPGAVIREVEKSRGGLVEADIVHDSKQKDVYFKEGGDWLYTKWDILHADLPEAAKNAVLDANPDYHIDEVDYVESPTGDFYEVEIKKHGSADKYVNVTAEGLIVD